MLHLSFNFAGSINDPRWGAGIRSEFEPEQSVWDAAIEKMAAQKLNMVLINLDDSVMWRSHPELALKNSWTPDRLHEELQKIRKRGIEPIPMLNFSTSHDAWLGEYAKMVSTKPYYKVCKDLIAEAIEIFDTPRFFHFGMGEEKYAYQDSHKAGYILVRQKELWWADLYFYFAEAMQRSVRPWVWSDYLWDTPDRPDRPDPQWENHDMFFKMMPKYAVQSNWYHGGNFDPEKNKAVKAYLELAAAGYDQIPTGGNAETSQEEPNDKSFEDTVDFCTKHIPDKQLTGFLQSMRLPTIEKFRPGIMRTIELAGAVRGKFSPEPK